MLIYVTMEGCVHCHRMLETTYAHGSPPRSPIRSWRWSSTVRATGLGSWACGFTHVLLVDQDADRRPGRGYVNAAELSRRIDRHPAARTSRSDRGQTDTSRIGRPPRVSRALASRVRGARQMPVTWRWLCHAARDRYVVPLRRTGVDLPRPAIRRSGSRYSSCQWAINRNSANRERP
jgi:hypothetical protein